MNDQLQYFSWPQPSFDSKKLDLTSKATLSFWKCHKIIQICFCYETGIKMAQKSLNDLKTSSTSEADMEAVEVEFRKWLHFQKNAWISSWQLFANLILSNLSVHGLK